MTLRDLCRCGHARSSHEDGGAARGCRTCRCAGWAPAYRVYDHALPAGVLPLRDLSNGLTLVECRHDAAGASCGVCGATGAMTAGYGWPVKFLAFTPRELVLL